MSACLLLCFGLDICLGVVRGRRIPCRMSTACVCTLLRLSAGDGGSVGGTRNVPPGKPQLHLHRMKFAFGKELAGDERATARINCLRACGRVYVHAPRLVRAVLFYGFSFARAGGWVILHQSPVIYAHTHWRSDFFRPRCAACRGVVQNAPQENGLVYLRTLRARVRVAVVVVVSDVVW